jgi:UDP-N-acetylglucosamine--N-acetylmuramyl-(pentapeptide) pyrophosphoryl-undecaprenol N-acetylglucosamine transferase
MRYKSFLIGVLSSLALLGLAFFAVRFSVQRSIYQQASPWVAYVAGCSGGHVVPALTHAQGYIAQHPGSQVLFFSTDTPAVVVDLLQKATHVAHHVPLTLGNIPRGAWLAWPGFAWDFVRTCWTAAWELITKKPAYIMATGGYIGVPVVLIARALGIPVYLYNLDVVPGEAARFLSKWVPVTYVCFDETKKYFPDAQRVELVPYPLRFTSMDRISKQAAREKLGLAQDKKIVVVLGGSKGSEFLNEAIPAAVALIPDHARYLVLHQTGGGKGEKTSQDYASKGIAAQVFAFRHDIGLVYAAADAVVARAGAGTLFELQFFGVPALIVPLETQTTMHQIDNARAMVAQYPGQFKFIMQGALENNTQALSDAIAGLVG